jgi:hypothetical protein
VNFFEDDAGGTAPPPPAPPARTARKTRSRRNLRVQRIAILVVALFVIVLLLTLWIRSCQHNQTVSSYRDYFTAVGQIIDDSNKVGKDLAAIVDNPRRYTAPELSAKLDAMVGAQKDAATRAQLLKPPGRLQSQNAQFALGMQVRLTGMQLMRAALQAVMAGQAKLAGVTISEGSLAAYAGYFTGPDAYYTDLFYAQAQKAMKDDGVTGVTVPTSTYFLTSGMFATDKLQAMLKHLPGSSIGGTHGDAVNGVSVQSGGKVQPLVGGRTTQVKASSDMVFLVAVQNQGTATETGVNVTLTLQPPGGAQAQTLSRTITTIKKGQTINVQFTGFNIQPNSLGRVSKLTARVAKVPGEKNLTNNTLYFNIILKL